MPDNALWQYEYNLTDHLGNVRAVFAVNQQGTAELRQKTDYYPFGMVMNQSPHTGSSPENKFLYNGKELQDDVIAGTKLDWYDYGARMYDAVIGRWHVVDPHAENYPNASPYAYVENNPIIRIDPDGRDWYIANKAGANDEPLWLPSDNEAKDVYGEGSFINLGNNIAQEVVITADGDASFGESFEEPDITGKVLAPQTIVSDITYFNMSHNMPGGSLSINMQKGDQVWLDLTYVDEGTVPRVETTIFDTEGLGGSAFRQISASKVSYSKPGFLEKLFGVVNTVMDFVDSSKTVKVNGVQVYKSSTRYEGKTLKPYIY